jgi:hypothetical protein
MITAFGHDGIKAPPIPPCHPDSALSVGKVSLLWLSVFFLGNEILLLPRKEKNDKIGVILQIGARILTTGIGVGWVVQPYGLYAEGKWGRQR